MGDGGEGCSLDESRVGRPAAGWIQDENSNAALSPPLQRFVASPRDSGGWTPSPGPGPRGFPVSALKAVWIISQCQWRREWMVVCLHVSAL